MRQALELALEWIEKQPEETPHSKYDLDTRYVVLKELEAALEQPEQPKVRTGDCLLVGVCASEGHKIQAKQEPWRESASDYERGVIDGRQMQMQSSVDKAVNAMSRTWIGLTDEEREQVINLNTTTGLWHMAKAIEAKLKEKNNG